MTHVCGVVDEEVARLEGISLCRWERNLSTGLGLAAGGFHALAIKGESVWQLLRRGVDVH